MKLDRYKIVQKSSPFLLLIRTIVASSRSLKTHTDGSSRKKGTELLGCCMVHQTGVTCQLDIIQDFADSRTKPCVHTLPNSAARSNH